MKEGIKIIGCLTLMLNGLFVILHWDANIYRWHPLAIAVIKTCCVLFFLYVLFYYVDKIVKLINDR